MYTRAVASDFDDWERKHGNPGWGFKDMLPYLKKACDTHSLCVIDNRLMIVTGGNIPSATGKRDARVLWSSERVFRWHFR